MGAIVDSLEARGALFVSHFPSRMVTDGTSYLISNLVPTKPQRLPDDLRLFERWGNRSYAETLGAQGGPFDEQFRILGAIEQGGRPSLELYDLAQGDDALDDRVSEPERRATVERLTAQMAHWRQCTGDFVSSPDEVVRRRYVLGDNASTLFPFEEHDELGSADAVGRPGLAPLGPLDEEPPLRTTTVTGFPPFLTRDNPYLELELWTDARIAILVQYQRKGDASFDPTLAVRGYAEPGGGRMLFDMGAEPAWSGAIVELRLVVVAAPGAQIELQRLRRGRQLALEPAAP